jgi:hypothetical protein
MLSGRGHAERAAIPPFRREPTRVVRIAVRRRSAYRHAVRERDTDKGTSRPVRPAPESAPPLDLLALQRSAGNQACMRLLQRKTTASPAGGLLVQFTVGAEISSQLAAEALARTANGPLADDDLGALRETALGSGRTIDDDERMFLAALLDAGNAAQLQKQRAGAGFATGSSFTVASDRISAADRERVRDFGRDEDEEVSMALGGTRSSHEQRIVRLGGEALAARARKVIALAKADRVPLQQVLDAMLAAASDSTPGDRVLAGAAYVIARRARLPVAVDLLAGDLKVDEVAPDYIPGAAMYSMSGEGHKGDTVYLPSSFDVASLADQGALVHELTHAVQDKAGPGQLDLARAELEAYRVQARYWLSQLGPLDGMDLPPAAAAVAAKVLDVHILALIIETRARPEYGNLVFQLNRVSPNHLSDSDYDAANAETDEEVEARAIRALRGHSSYRHKHLNTSGLRGESRLDR